MKVLVFGDTPIFQNIEENPDVIFLLGDIDYYMLRQISDAYPDVQKFGVLGNHDSPDFFEGTDIINVHKTIVDFKGMKITGFEGSPEYNKRKHLQYTESDVYEFVKDLEAVDIFLAHSNPGIEGRTSLVDGHRGFSSFNYYINEKKPARFFHGHLHEDKDYVIGDTIMHSVYPHRMIEI